MASKAWAVLTGIGSIAFAYEFSVVLLEIQVFFACEFSVVVLEAQVCYAKDCFSNTCSLNATVGAESTVCVYTVI